MANIKDTAVAIGTYGVYYPFTYGVYYPLKYVVYDPLKYPAATISNYTSTLMNIAGISDFGAFHNPTNTDNYISPAAQREAMNLFKPDRSYAFNFTAENSFETCLGDRVCYLREFISQTKDKNAQERITAFVNLDSVKNKMELLQHVAEIEPIKKKFADYKKSIDAIKADPNSNPDGLIGKLFELRENAKNALAKQLTSEQEQIKELFDTPVVCADLTRNDMNAKILKKDMLNTLQNTHDEALEAFNKSMRNNIEQLLKAKEQENASFAYLAMLYKHSPKMKEAIEKEIAAAENDPNFTGAAIFTETDGNLKSLKGVKLENINITTMTGVTINASENGKGYQMQLPNRFFSSRYYHTPYQDNVLIDMTMLAERIKADGANGITMNIKHPDPDHALLLAQKAYIACSNSGFSKNKITIKIDGNPVSLLDVAKKGDQEGKKGLFNQTRLQAIDEKAKQFEKDRHRMMWNESDLTASDKIKKELAELKNTASKNQANSENNDTSKNKP